MPRERGRGDARRPGHGLDAGRILEIADGYAPEEDTDFNLAPARDIKRALVGRNLACAMYAEPAFD